MTSLTVLIIVTVKVVFLALLFCMPVAVLLTWADRRQGAMIQDRVGPNRAVIFMPGKLAAFLVFVPALAVAALALAWAQFNKIEGHTSVILAVVSNQLAIASVWATLFVIAGRVRVRGVINSFDLFVKALGDPRAILGVGVLTNLAFLGAFVMLKGTPAVATLSYFSVSSGPALFAAVVLIGASYAALNLTKLPRVGLRLAGVLHPLADGLKMVFKEDLVPPTADRFIHGLAPFIAFFPVLVVLAVVPFGDSLCVNSTSLVSDLLSRAPSECGSSLIKLQILDIDAGLLFYFALGGTGVIGAALAGWASDNKYSLLGGLRATSQMVSYEVTMGLTLIGAIMIYGTLRIDQMVQWQHTHAWGIFVQPLGFILFLVAAIAEAKRTPFDLPEGESEIVAGYFTEYSGMKFAMFFFAEYVTIITASALMVGLFLGGWHLPFIDRQGIRVALGGTVYWQLALPQIIVVLISVAAFMGKTVLLCWLQLLIRWTVPRFRYDQLMKLGWRILLPFSIGNILVTGLVQRLVMLGGDTTASVLSTAGDVTKLLIVGLGLWAAAALVVELLKPAKHRKLLFASAARIADQIGGIRSRRMGA
jgi:NADH-quinone oxidoreductase subunit H